MDDKTTKYLIAGGAIVTLITVLILAFIFATFCSHTSSPLPPSPSPSPSPSSTQTPSAFASAYPPAMPTASSTPGVTPTSIPAYATTPSSTPVPIPMPTIDPYMQPGWPYYSMQYGPGIEQTKGTITVHIQDLEGGPIVSGEAGVLPGSGAPSEFFDFDHEIAVPTSWTSIGADGSARLGEFDDGTYTVYYRQNGYYYLTRTVVISDSHRVWDVNFVVQSI